MNKLKITEISIKKIKDTKLSKRLPELYQLKKIVENSDWHNQETVFDHILTILRELNKIIKNSSSKIKNYLNQKVDNYTRENLLFLAALFHDIGKKETLRKNNNHTSCPNHEKISFYKTKQILNRFDLSNKEKAIITKIIKNHGLIHLIINPENNKLDQEYKKFRSKYSEIFLELILLAIADTAGSYLQNTKPDEFKFRISFYNNILKSY